VPGRAEPPRLLVVSPSGGRGGAETMLLRLVQAAIAAGWQVLALVPTGPLHAALVEAGATTSPLPVIALGTGARGLAVARLGAACLRAATSVRRAERDADVLVANGLLVLPVLRLVPRRSRRVWWAHDVVVRGDRVRLVRWAAPAVDRVVAVSEAVRARLAHLPVPVHVVRNGVDVSGRPLTARPPGTVVGCAAALTPWKGQHVLLEAVARIPELELELLGAAALKDEGYAARLRARADRDDLAGRVRFLGHVDDPAPLMRRWSAGVSASTDPEASGLAFLEGLALGVPQVVTSGGGPEEVLGAAGLVVPPDDASALAAALSRLLGEAGLWERCAAAAPAVVAAVGDRRRQEQELLRLLRDTAAR
jgi:glycosyltransferase involved in cell wall biosynthesis